VGALLGQGWNEGLLVTAEVAKEEKGTTVYCGNRIAVFQSLSHSHPFLNLLGRLRTSHSAFARNYIKDIEPASDLLAGAALNGCGRAESAIEPPKGRRT
jgi:hypothetical protein